MNITGAKLDSLLSERIMLVGRLRNVSAAIADAELHLLIEANR